jgi:hypothetical protein
MIQFPDHPGMVTMVELFDGSRREVSAGELPEDERFYYFNGEVSADEPADATERVPVVLVETASLDGAGNLVPFDAAKTVIIKKFGPDRRPLRTTTMYRW